MRSMQWKVVMAIRMAFLLVGLAALVIGFVHMRQYPDFWSNPCSPWVFICCFITIALKAFTPDAPNVSNPKE